MLYYATVMKDPLFPAEQNLLKYSLPYRRKIQFTVYYARTALLV
jgi:hypothetical protein